jgi:hypothetical protein
VDRRCSTDLFEEGAQTEDGSARCTADSAVAGGRPLSSDLGAEFGEPGSERTTLASSPHGAGADASDESVAGGSAERRVALEEAVVARTGPATVGIISTGAGRIVAGTISCTCWDELNPTILELTQAVEREAEKCPDARQLRTHPGVGALTALAFVLILGDAERFRCGKQVASYLGLVPSEKSSGSRRRLGHITKQGSSLLRFLLGEAAQATARSLPEWRSKYFHLMQRHGRNIAKVAMARRLAVRLYWMWRRGWDYEQLQRFGSHAGEPEIPMVCSRTPRY